MSLAQHCIFILTIISISNAAITPTEFIGTTAIHSTIPDSEFKNESIFCSLPKCIVQCNHQQPCEHANLFAFAGQQLTVQCMEIKSCLNTNIYAPNATRVNIECTTSDDDEEWLLCISNWWILEQETFGNTLTRIVKQYEAIKLKVYAIKDGFAGHVQYHDVHSIITKPMTAYDKSDIIHKGLSVQVFVAR